MIPSDRKPDLNTEVGKGYKLKMFRDRGHPQYTGLLNGWLIHSRRFHPVWSWWVLTVITLEDLPGCPPANKHFEGAQYEFNVFSLNPEHAPPDPDQMIGPGNMLHTLMPYDQCVQFNLVTEQQACSIADLAAKAILLGGLTPDQDARGQWQASIRMTVEHMVTGGHPKVSA